MLPWVIICMLTPLNKTRDPDGVLPSGAGGR